MNKVLVFPLLAVVLLIAGNAFSVELNPEAKAQMRQIGLACNTGKECREEILAANPTSQDFTVAVAIYLEVPAGSTVFAKGIRDTFGDKVFIEFFNPFRKTEKEGGTTFYVRFRSNWVEFEKAKETGSAKLIVYSDVSSKTLEKSFSSEASGTDLRAVGTEVVKKLSLEVAEWMKREVELQKKIKEKSQ